MWNPLREKTREIEDLEQYHAEQMDEGWYAVVQVAMQDVDQACEEVSRAKVSISQLQELSCSLWQFESADLFAPEGSLCVGCWQQTNENERTNQPTTTSKAGYFVCLVQIFLSLQAWVPGIYVLRPDGVYLGMGSRYVGFAAGWEFIFHFIWISVVRSKYHLDFSGTQYM